MIKIPDNVLKELCDKLAINQETLTFLGGGREDSDGIAYIYQQGQQRMVLKILAFPMADHTAIERLSERVKYANYLGENGISIAYPVHDNMRNLFEVVLSETDRFVAYIMEFHEGSNPKCEELNKELVTKWGRLTGLSHKITKSFSLNEVKAVSGCEGEIASFQQMCKDEAVSIAWKDIEKEFSEFPKEKDSYGFIHNDNHQYNILVADSKITLIDFDVACPQFFMHDITTPAQGMMFDVTGGMMSPVRDEERLKQFYYDFINGYEQENTLSNFWYQKLSTFINYRRMLLFTVMQGWLNTEPQLKQGFIDMIKNPPRIEI